MSTTLPLLAPNSTRLSLRQRAAATVRSGSDQLDTPTAWWLRQTARPASKLPQASKVSDRRAETDTAQAGTLPGDVGREWAGLLFFLFLITFTFLV